MGRHQWELAIAFFLLGDDFSSAVNVCVKNLQDEQLAIVICRLVEGSGGPLERNLISNILLPQAVEKGDNWLSSLLEVCHIHVALFFRFYYVENQSKNLLNYISSEFSVDVRELLSVYQ
jgi:hypothetical protein